MPLHVEHVDQIIGLNSRLLIRSTTDEIDRLLVTCVNIVAAETRRQAVRLLSGRYSTYPDSQDATANSLQDATLAMVKRSDRYTTVTCLWKGRRKRSTRRLNSTVAYFNEYGAHNRGIFPRHFVSIAMQKTEQTVLKKIEEHLLSI